MNKIGDMNEKSNEDVESELSFNSFAEMIRPYAEIGRRIVENAGLIANRIMEIYSPFRDIINNIQEILVSAAKGMSAVFRPYIALSKLGDNQYIQWEGMTDDFIDLIINSDNPNKALRILYEKNHYHDFYYIAEQCMNSKLLGANVRILRQAINSFRVGDTDLAAIGLMVVIDGTLSRVPGTNKKDTSIYKRAEKLCEKLKNEEALDSDEFATLSLIVSFEKTITSVGQKSDFSSKEPQNINRHWMLHGRSKRRKTKLDCVKLLRFLYSIIIIQELI